MINFRLIEGSVWLYHAHAVKNQGNTKGYELGAQTKKRLRTLRTCDHGDKQ